MEQIELKDLPEGKMAEIVLIKNDSLIKHIGVQVGMTVLILKRAVKSFIQVGYNQLEVSQDILEQIIVREI